MMMMNLLRRSAIAIGRQSKSKLASFSSATQPCSGIPKSSKRVFSNSFLSKDSTGANGLLFRFRNPQASICTEARPKNINSSYFTRSFASRTSKEPGNQQNKAKKEVTTVEDPFDSPTYHIPEKPVTFTEGASYSLVILAGLGVAGAAGYGVFKELIFQPKE
jgi:import inner membrane translocase subunit TIM21